VKIEKMFAWVREHWAVLLLSILLLFLFGIIIYGYLTPPGWTGLKYYKEITYPNPGRVIEIKTAWDWMELLFIPLILLLVSVFIDWTAKRRDRVRQDIQNSYETLQKYMDLITELIKDNKFQDQAPENIKNLVYSRTLTTFETLDPKHKAYLLSFLKTSNLIQINNTIVSLKGANLRDALIHYLDLSEINLIGVDFRRAEFINVKLEGANLTEADLRKAKMFNCSLNNAIFTDALTYGIKTIPHGQKEKAILASSNPNIPI
jgi:hypothetical protein